MKGLSVKNKKNARKRIAVFVTFANSYGRQIIQGVSEYARVYGPWKIHLDYGFSRWSFPPWLEEWDGDGIVSRISSPEIVEFSRSRGIPVVDLNERVPMRGLPIVYNDNEAAGRLAAEHFLKCGCSRFGFIGQNGYLWSDERRRGFCERIREAGGSVEVFEGRAFEDWNVERADYLSAFWERERPAIREWIRGLPKPIAVLACNSFRAIQALEEAETVRVGIPEALALISGDDDEIVCFDR